MRRTYTLTLEEYSEALKRASLSEYRMLTASAQVKDNEVRITIESEERKTCQS